MKNKKFKLLFDGNILSNGVRKNSNRSGIYFTAFNIFKQMLKKDNLEITLYTNQKRYKNLKKFMKVYFPNNNIKIIIISDLPEKSRVDLLSYISTTDENILTKYFLNTIIYMRYYLQKYFLKIQAIFLSLNNFDAVFSPYSAFPSGVNYMHIKRRFNFLYDMILLMFPQYYTLTKKHWFNKLFSTLNSSDTYFTDSESARQDFLRYAPQIKPENIHTTYLGCDFNYIHDDNKLNKIKEKYNIPKDKKYLFSLCTLEPRKNLIRIIKTFLKFTEKNNINDLILVMGGGQWDVFMNLLNKETSELDMSKILKIGYVDDEDLPVLYSGAEWFTFTSEYEGFGLPVLEAMKCGCPVITSNNSSLPEVIGDAGIQIDCYSDEQHIEAYEKYYYNENLRKENSAKGLERAKMFTWENTVNKMLDIMLENNK